MSVGTSDLNKTTSLCLHKQSNDRSSPQARKELSRD